VRHCHDLGFNHRCAGFRLGRRAARRLDLVDHSLHGDVGELPCGEDAITIRNGESAPRVPNDWQVNLLVPTF